MAPATESTGVKRLRDRNGRSKESSLDQGRRDSFAMYIRKLAEQQHQRVCVSPKAITVINILANDMSERVAAEAAQLARFYGTPDISVKEIRAAVKLLLPGDVSKHAYLSEAYSITE